MPQDILQLLHGCAFSGARVLAPLIPVPHGGQRYVLLAEEALQEPAEAVGVGLRAARARVLEAADLGRELAVLDPADVQPRVSAGHQGQAEVYEGHHGSRFALRDTNVLRLDIVVGEAVAV